MLAHKVPAQLEAEVVAQVALGGSDNHSTYGGDGKQRSIIGNAIWCCGGGGGSGGSGWISTGGRGGGGKVVGPSAVGNITEMDGMPNTGSGDGGRNTGAIVGTSRSGNGGLGLVFIRHPA